MTVFRTFGYKLAFVIMAFAVTLFTLVSPIETSQAQTTRRDVVVSQAVARVGDHILTLRELEINKLIERVLQPYSGQKKELEFEQHVNAVLIEWVVYLEAKSFGVTNVTSAEVKFAVNKINQAYQKSGVWRDWEVGAKELNEMTERKLIAKKFIQFKTDSSLVPVTDEEAKEYFEKNKGRFGNLPFERFKVNIKRFLIRRQVDSRLKDWFDVLQRKYKIKVFKS